MSIAEVLREKVVSDLFRIKTMQECWPLWHEEIVASCNGNLTGGSLIRNLGPALGDVFKSTNNAGRNQASQSAGGAAWEALVCWYLNLCLIGTRAVVVKKKSHLPTPISEALTVTYGNVKTNTESDLVAIIFPRNGDLDGFNLKYTGRAKVELDQYLENIIGQLEVCVIQCKTNWNDNAQIPMLWDMIYSATGFRADRASVGVNGNSVRDVQRFSYAFVTVPSNGVSKYNRNSAPVLRLSNLSGGNFWGHPALNGVAGSVADIFPKNFSSALQGLGRTWPIHLSNELLLLPGKYSYFNLQ